MWHVVVDIVFSIVAYGMTLSRTDSQGHLDVLGKKPFPLVDLRSVIDNLDRDTRSRR